MPNPLSRVTANPGVLELGNVGTRTLAARATLAVAAMECIAAWSHVENFMLALYVDLAGGAEADAAAVYLAMDSASFKAAVVRTLAERKLTHENLSLFNAITKLVKTAQRERDRLAHWIWGTASNLPAGILLADPRHLEHEPDNIFVYTARDFEEMRMKFERLAGFGFKFRWIVRGHIANRNNELFDALCQEPEISEILNRPRQQDQSQPSK